MCSVYGSSKFAVRALTQSAGGFVSLSSKLQIIEYRVAVEWGKHHIRVNAYAPGATETPLLTDMGVVFGNLIGAPAQAYSEIASQSACASAPFLTK